MTAAERLARAFLLFHKARIWTPDAQLEWEQLTGLKEASNKSLGDLARLVVQEASQAAADETCQELERAIAEREKLPAAEARSRANAEAAATRAAKVAEAKWRVAAEAATRAAEATEEAARRAIEAAEEAAKRAAEEARTEATVGTGNQYLIWSDEHRGWRKPNCRGYTPSLSRAGRFDRVMALKICKRAVYDACRAGRITDVPVSEKDVRGATEWFRTKFPHAPPQDWE